MKKITNLNEQAKETLLVSAIMGLIVTFAVLFI
jgi:hypothetical protein